MLQSLTRRTRIRAATYLTAAFVLLAGTIMQQNAQLIQYQRLTANSYTHAFSELTASVQRMSTSLEKQTCTTSHPDRRLGGGNLWPSPGRSAGHWRAALRLCGADPDGVLYLQSGGLRPGAGTLCRHPGGLYRRPVGDGESPLQSLPPAVPDAGQAGTAGL